jgi:hypothetical protein
MTVRLKHRSYEEIDYYFFLTSNVDFLKVESVILKVSFFFALHESNNIIEKNIF